jgi:hypothetical protein
MDTTKTPLSVKTETCLKSGVEDREALFQASLMFQQKKKLY